MKTETTEQEASAKYCPMAMRAALDLKPGRTDSISMLLWNAIYQSRSMAEFENCVNFSIGELRKALEKVREL